MSNVYDMEWGDRRPHVPPPVLPTAPLSAHLGDLYAQYYQHKNQANKHSKWVEEEFYSPSSNEPVAFVVGPPPPKGKKLKPHGGWDTLIKAASVGIGGGLAGLYSQSRTNAPPSNNRYWFFSSLRQENVWSSSSLHSSSHVVPSASIAGSWSSHAFPSSSVPSPLLKLPRAKRALP